jgi:hypothetical protein
MTPSIARRMAPLMRALMVLALAAPMMLMFAGCGGGGDVNEKNYDKVNNGMTEVEVEKVLGKPSNKSPDRDLPIPTGGKAVVYKSKDGEKTVTVIFVGGKVADKTQSGF